MVSVSIQEQDEEDESEDQEEDSSSSEDLYFQNPVQINATKDDEANIIRWNKRASSIFQREGRRGTGIMAMHSHIDNGMICNKIHLSNILEQKQEMMCLSDHDGGYQTGNDTEFV